MKKISKAAEYLGILASGSFFALIIEYGFSDSPATGAYACVALVVVAQAAYKKARKMYEEEK